MISYFCRDATISYIDIGKDTGDGQVAVYKNKQCMGQSFF